MSIEPAEGPARRLVPVRGTDAGHDPDTPKTSAPTLAPADDQDVEQDADAGQATNPRGARALGIVVGISLAAVIVAPVTLSATHLIKWASSAAGLGLPVSLAWLVFIALDMAAVTCIGMVVLCAMKGEGAGGFSLATWGFAFASAYANYSGGHGAGRWFFPAMSLAGPTLLEMVLAKVKRWARIDEGSQMSARPKFGIRWVPGIAFNETRRAWAAARRENIGKVSEAIAFVREVDTLAKMTDADAVRYAQAAARSTDPYELRQWLTSRGKDIAQAALPTTPVALPAAPEADDDTVRGDSPPRQIPTPEPKALRELREAHRELREALRLPPVNEHVEKPKAAPQRRELKPPAAPTPPRKAKGDPTSHPKWADGVAAYRKSVKDGNPMSQHELARYLEMKNRTLAAKIQAHVSTELGKKG